MAQHSPEDFMGRFFQWGLEMNRVTGIFIFCTRPEYSSSTAEHDDARFSTGSTAKCNFSAN